MEEPVPEPPETKWHMSYAFVRHGSLHFGSCVSDEHPVRRVVRWNDQHDPSRYVLLSYRELTAEEVTLLGDAVDNSDFEIPT